MTSPFPFSAVVGQDDAKLALLLAALEPQLGGVLLRGDKGSAKTTLARGLAALLPGDAPFVELPLGATEDRVVGSLDLGALLRDGSPEVRPGLLAAAHGGVLYVDEINLLADHLVDVLLDVAVSGTNRIERDGVAHEHPARFVLIGSMNPEEGELRPQLLDRFGLVVDVHASTDRAERAEAVRRRLSSDRSLDALAAQVADDAALAARVTGAGRVPMPSDDLIDLASAVAIEVGAEGLRADLMLCRAAAAHALWRGADQADEDDLRAVAPLVLGHRRRRSPLDPPGIPPEELDDAFDRAGPPDPPDPSDAEIDPPDGDAHGDGPDPDGRDPEGGRDAPARPPAAPIAPPALHGAAAPRDARAGRRGQGEADRGRFVRAAEPTADRPVTAGTVAVAATAVATATRRATAAAGPADPSRSTSVEPGDLKRAVREQRTGTLVILCVDASGSMGADRRIELAKGAVLGLLTDAYQRRDRVALVTFGGQGAHVALRPTASVEIAKARLAELPTGGTSPIAEGLDAVHQLVAGSSGDHGLDPLVVVITDGRATGADDAVARSQASAARLAAADVAVVVIDAESGATRLGLAAELALAAGGPCLPLDGLVDGSLERTIRLQLT